MANIPAPHSREPIKKAGVKILNEVLLKNFKIKIIIYWIRFRILLVA